MKTKNNLKKVTLGLILILTVTMFTGCGQFDASRYTKACLDLVCTGATKDYVAMTKISEKDAKKTYDQFIDTEVSSMKISGITDEQIEKFRSLYKDMYKKAKYTVGKATKKDKSYTVPVTVKQCIVFDGVIDYAKKELQKQDIKGKSSTELTGMIIDYMYDAMKNNLKKGSYADKETKVDITVSLGSDKKYTISTSDYKKVMEALFDTDALQQK